MIMTYGQAINDALRIAEEIEPSVFVMGEGVDDPKAVFGTTKNLPRCYDMPLAEEGFTGFAIGAALMGMTPVIVHARVDFALVCMNQLINIAAKFYHSSGGKQNPHFVVRMLIGRGWGQGSQHSQSLFSMFAHIPGLTVVAPSSALDAKGILLWSIFEAKGPVIFIEHRRLYDIGGEVPEDYYVEHPGARNVQYPETFLAEERKTIVTFSYTTPTACLEKPGAEIIDLSSLRPLYGRDLILDSFKRTGKLEIWEGDWVTCGISAEIAAWLAEERLGVVRRGFQDCPAPTCWKLEDEYYGTSLPDDFRGPF